MECDSIIGPSVRMVMMLKRILFVSLCFMVVSIDLPQPFSGRALADVPTVVDPIFGGDLHTLPLDMTPFQSIRRDPRAASYILLGNDGRLRIINLRNAGTVADFQPLGTSFLEPFSIELFSMGDGMTPDTLLIGPNQPSQRGLSGFRLTSPQPTLLGETPDDWIRAGGLRIASGNLFGDHTPEIIFSSGPNGPGSVMASSLGANQQFGFGPFGDFRGGVFVAAGDLDGDGFSEILSSTETLGGLVSIASVRDNGVRGRGVLAPFGPGFNGGIRVAAGDLTGDGRAELITATASGAPIVRVYTQFQGSTRLIGNLTNFADPNPFTTADTGVTPFTFVIDGNPTLGALYHDRLWFFQAMDSRGLLTIDPSNAVGSLAQSPFDSVDTWTPLLPR